MCCKQSSMAMVQSIDSVMRGTHLFIGVHLPQLLQNTRLNTSMLDEALLPAECRAFPPCPARRQQQVDTHRWDKLQEGGSRGLSYTRVKA